MSFDTDFLKHYRDRAVKFGNFTLSSGKTSNYYIDSKQILFNGELISQIAEKIASWTITDNLQAIGGLEQGALPITAAVVQYYWHEYGRLLEGFFVRKQPKLHGTGNIIEGRLSPGDRVCIVDDVLTSGESILKAIKAVEAAGGQIVTIIPIVDRLEGGTQALFEAGYHCVYPLCTIEELGITPPCNP